MMLFFGLVFTVGLLPPGNYSADILNSQLPCLTFSIKKIAYRKFIVYFVAVFSSYLGLFLSYAAFTLNSFDNQERNLTFVKTISKF